MTATEARAILLAHAGMPADFEDPRFTSGFLGMLRPHKQLYEHNFHEVMLALKTIASSLENPAIDRELISALWGICHFGRAWGLETGSMLQRNDLISIADAERLSEWLNIVSYTVASLLDDSGIKEAFEPYSLYQKERTDPTG